MAHTIKDKDKLLARVRRIAGQVAAIERGLTEERDCSSILQLIASSRGAIGGLMSEVLEEHIQFHVMAEKNAAKLIGRLRDGVPERIFVVTLCVHFSSSPLTSHLARHRLPAPFAPFPQG